MGLNEELLGLSESLTFVVPEILLLSTIVLAVIAGLIFRKDPFLLLQMIAISGILGSLVGGFIVEVPGAPFMNMISVNAYSRTFGILADLGALLTIVITRKSNLQKSAEYFAIIVAITLGAHILVLSTNFVLTLLSLELISLSSYALASWKFDRGGSEGSLKYFLFGSVATAVMLYGISILFGLTGTFDFSSALFTDGLKSASRGVLLVAGMLTLAGLLFKIAAVPMHLWAPDVYESAPTPIVAFFSVVPKLAGLGAMVKIILALYAFGQTAVDWQILLAAISILSIGVGNFSALWQRNPKRLLAYSSVAQSGFLLVGVTSLSLEAVQATIFYGFVLLLMNFLTFLSLQHFESNGVVMVKDFTGLGRRGSLSSLAILTGLVSLVGLPITAGFTAKLLIFSRLWAAYDESPKTLLLVLFVFGLVSTAIALFYYMKIPFYLFFKTRGAADPTPAKIPLVENLLSLILIASILTLFFRPDVLMGWIIRINFVL